MRLVEPLLAILATMPRESLSDPSCACPCADRDGKQVTNANETQHKKGSTEQLIFNDPYQGRR